MCLGIPGKILSIEESDPLFRMGEVSFSGVLKNINLAYVPEAEIGDYVVVHVGFAISVLSEDRAKVVQELIDTLTEERP